MKILQILPILLGLMLGSYGTHTINDFRLKKIEKRHKRILFEKTDSLKQFAYKINTLASSDSLKGVFIGELQSTMQAVNKQNHILKKDTTTKAATIKALNAWIEDARDGVVTDTVTYKINLFGKKKRIK